MYISRRKKSQKRNVFSIILRQVKWAFRRLYDFRDVRYVRKPQFNTVDEKIIMLMTIMVKSLY